MLRVVVDPLLEFDFVGGEKEFLLAPTFGFVVIFQNIDV